MSVVTISRGSFSGGKKLAECLAQRLGYRCIDRDVIVEKAAAAGVSQQELHEALQKPPTFLERFTHKKYLYLTLIQAALADEVRTGRVVYHGNAGHLLLTAGPPVLRVRLIAPLRLRVAMARERLRLTEQEAVDYIRRRDDERRRWTQYLYGADWGDPSLYDVVVNIEYITVPEACRALAALVRARASYEFGPEYRAILEDLATASRVRAKLALTPETSHLEFSVLSRNGVVHLRGKVPNLDLLPRIEQIAVSVPGVQKVNLTEVSPAPQV